MANNTEFSDAVDLEVSSKKGGQPNRGSRFRIRIDGERFIVDKSTMSGRELLELVGRVPVEDFILIQRRRGHNNEVINLDEIVDFTTPGIERFVTAKLGNEDLVVTVFAPRSPDPKHFTWDKSKLVRDAAQEAATAFGYVGGNPSLKKDDVVLDNSKTLEAAGVEHGDELELIDTGGGV